MLVLHSDTILPVCRGVVAVAGHLTYLLVALSYLVGPIVWLRAIALLASLFSIFFNYFAPSEPLWIPIGWNCLFVLINSCQLIRIAYHSRSSTLRTEEIELARSFFRDAAPSHLSQLFRFANWRYVEPGESIVRQGDAQNALALLVEGETEILVDGKSLGNINKRTFIGEIGYLTGKAATATVTATDRCQILTWSHRDLRKLLSHDSRLNLLFQRWLALDLTRKLDRSASRQDADVTEPLGCDADSRAEGESILLR